MRQAFLATEVKLEGTAVHLTFFYSGWDTRSTFTAEAAAHPHGADKRVVKRRQKWAFQEETGASAARGTLDQGGI